jgi:broad specificity phosphatase PhoE
MSQKYARTQIDLLRHGQLATPGLFCAHPDEPLSKKGLKDLSTATHNGCWDIIVSSPFQRCREFAESLAKQNQCELQIDKHFKEMDFGDWTGIKTDTLWQQESKQLQKLWQVPDSFIAPGGESMQAFISQVEQGIQRLIDKHKNSSVLLITHAGVMRVILASALEITHQSALRFSIEHASLSRIHYYPDGVCSLYSHGLRRIE